MGFDHVALSFTISLAAITQRVWRLANPVPIGLEKFLSNGMPVASALWKYKKEWTMLKSRSCDIGRCLR